MAFTDNDLVEIGARLPTQRLLEQLPVSVAVARENAEGLGTAFPAAKTDELEGYLAPIETLFQEQSGGKFDAGTGNVGVNAALGALKESIRDIIAAADNAFEEEPTIRDQFHKGGPLGKTVAATISKSEYIIALAQKNVAPLAEWGVTAEKIAATSTELAQLTAANTVQEQGMKNLPPKTRELYIMKGRAYLLLKKLARSGRRRYADNPAMAAKFNLDILKRKGKGPDKGPESPAE